MPVILVGLGGMGVGTVRRVKRKIMENPLTRGLADKSIFFVGIDVQEDYDAEIIDINMVKEFYLEDPWGLIETRANDINFQEWWIKGFEPPSAIMGELAAGQIRLCGRLVYYKYARKLSEFFTRIMAVPAEPISPNDTSLKIYLITSLGGGTGAGIFIDTAFLIKSFLRPRDKLWGLIFDGTVTDLFAKGTGIYGFGALTELERWMTKAREFDMTYEAITLRAPDIRIRLDNIFNAVFLVQGKNMDGRSFVGKFQKIVDDYKDFASEFLYTIITSSEFIQDVEANRWNRFAGLQNYNGRSLKYAGFAVSYISFPYEKVVEYCFAKYFLEHVSQGVADFALPQVENFKKYSLKTSESDGNLLTYYLHSMCPTYKSLEEKKQNAVDKLSYTKDINDFNTQYDETALGRTSISSTWTDQGFYKYEREIELKLTELFEESQKKILDQTKKFISSLNFENIDSWLQALKGAIQKEIDYIDKYKKREADDRGKMRKNMTEEAENVSNSKKFPIFGGTSFSSAKQAFLESIPKWFKSELAYFEYTKIKEFYDKLIQLIEPIIKTIGFLKSRLSEINTSHSNIVGFYTGRTWLLDPTRFEQDEYVLDLKIGISRDVIEQRIYENIKENLAQNSDDIVSQLSTGVKDPTRELKIRGVPEIFDEIHQTYSRGLKEEVALLEGRKENYYSELENLFDYSIGEAVKEIVRIVSVDQALEWYFEEIYNKLNDAKRRKNIEVLAMYRNNFNFLLGAEESKSLIDGNLPKDKWINTAIKALFAKMKSLTKPFIEIDLERLAKIWEETGITADKNIRDAMDTERVYVPQNFRFKNLGIDLNTHNDNYRITFYKQKGGVPLLCLKRLEDYHKSYNQNNERVKKTILEDKVTIIPCHIDKRFYSEWADNILKEKPIEEKIREDIQLLLALGFGLGLIERKAKKGFYLIPTPDEETKLASHLPKLIDRLSKDWTLRKNIQNIIYIKFEQNWYPEKKVEIIYEIFSIAYKKIKMLEPPKKGTIEIEKAHKIWKDLYDAAECTYIERRYEPKGYLVPKSNKEIEEIIDRLKRA